jgi:hypothetical protein
MKRIPAIVSIACFLALTACGGGSSSSDNSADNSAANTAANAAAPAASDAGGGMSSAMGDTSGVAAVPASLNCGAVKPVWVNLNTKVYHEPSDPYYGKTKHGEYLCPSVAKKDGYHRAGGGGSMSGSMSGHHAKGAGSGGGESSGGSDNSSSP